MIRQNMKQIAILKPYDIQVIDRPAPKVAKPTEIKVKTKVVGISIGTELHDYRGTMEKVPEEFKKIHPYSFPQFPGYENVGEVVEVGSAVHDVQVGDRIVSCGQHAEYVVVPREEALPEYSKVPDSVSNEEATCAVIGTTSLYGVQRAQIGYRDVVVTTGDGMVGIMAALHAKNAGARKSILVGKSTGKLELAEKAGVEKTINRDDKDWYEQVIAETGKSGADVVLEAVGSTLQTTGSIADACKICRHSGKIVLLGYHLAPQSDWILGGDFYFKEITMLNSRATGNGSHHPQLMDCFRKCQEYNYIHWTSTDLQREVVQLIADGKLNVKPLLTHKFPYTDVANVFKMIDEQKEPCVQVLLTDW
jgi:threonine dehydrogenase-like Zn-dependent dehydrogenase